MRSFIIAIFSTGAVLAALQMPETASAEAPADPPAYCVSTKGDFYPYSGTNCKRDYQLAKGNCRTTDGQLTAVAKDQCTKVGGIMELPAPASSIETPVPAPATETRELGPGSGPAPAPKH